MKNIKITKLILDNYGPFFTLIFNNKLFEVINRYLLWKIHNSNRNKPLAFSSQRLYAYDFYSFFKLLDKFKLDWNTLTTKNIRNLRDYLDQEKDIDRITINRKTYLWVEFYQWCKNNNIKVSYTPKYKKIKRNFNTDDNLFAHINYNSYGFVNEFYLSPLRNSSTYKVLNEDEFQKLKLQLRTKDIMYEAIAIVMITTGLRIDEVLQLRNITFPPSSILSNKEQLEYSYVPKGERSTGKKVSCIFPFETWHYISSVIFKLRKQRLISNNMKINYLFIDKSGKEIRSHHVQKVFREISNERDSRKIVPHMLRHTYATWIVIQWAKENKINNISESFYKDIHEMLSEQLNHKDISTTKKYCKTAAKFKFSKVLPQVNQKAYSKNHITESLNFLKKEGYE
jgi:integrase